MADQEKYLRPDVIQQVKQLDLRAKFIIEGFLVGLQRSPFQGFSAEFSEHQKYEPGDDPARLDWSVYAKTDRYYVKRYQAETNLTGYVAIDLSKSMAYPLPEDLGAAGMTKLDYSICLGAALTYLMISQCDAVGLVTFDRRVRMHLPARSRRSQLNTILAALSSSTASEPSDLPEALGQMASLIRHKSLVMLFSDLWPGEEGEGDGAEEAEAVGKGLHQLRHAGHDVILFHVLAESDVTFPYADMTEFVGHETDARLPPTDAKALRGAYLEALAEFRGRFRRICETAGVDYVPLHTGMPFDAALTEYLLERRNRF